MRSAVINLNKPSGITSQEAVTRVKRLFKAGKAGHCGTLDPYATGVLLICLNRATRLADYFQSRPKKYKAVLKLGETTDTQDAFGKLIEKTDSDDLANLDDNDIRNAVMSFVGKIHQTPPMFSALKKEGTPLYKFARKGIVVERMARQVEISSISIESIQVPFVTFTVECSKGTYIRTLCDDIGLKLGVGGHLKSLVRSAVGDFTVQSAVNIEQLGDANLIALNEALDFLKICRLPNEPQAPLNEPLTLFKGPLAKILNGVQIPLDLSFFKRPPDEGEVFQLQAPNGSFLGIGRLVDGQIKVEKLILDN